MNVSMDEINAMSSLVNALDDIDSGRANSAINEAVRTGNASGLPSADIDIAAMKNILTNLSDIDFGESVPAPNTQMPTPQIPHREFDSDFPDEGMSEVEWLAFTQGKPLAPYVPGQSNQSNAYQNPYIPAAQNNIDFSNFWMMETNQHKNSKTINLYSIKNQYTNAYIVKDVYMKEAASALLDMLKDGHAFTENKMIGVLSGAMQYTRLVENMIVSMKQRQTVLRESNYDAAKAYDSKIASQKVEAQKIKQNIIEFINKP